MLDENAVSGLILETLDLRRSCRVLRLWRPYDRRLTIDYLVSTRLALCSTSSDGSFRLS